MAIKIVSDAPTRSKRVTCPKCTFLLEYTGEDVQSGWSYDYTGGKDECHWIVCPRCSHRVTIRPWRAD